METLLLPWRERRTRCRRRRGGHGGAFRRRAPRAIPGVARL